MAYTRGFKLERCGECVVGKRSGRYVAKLVFRGHGFGPKAPFKLKQIWSIRVRLEMQGRLWELALFDLGIDSKLRACDLVNFTGIIVRFRNIQRPRPSILTVHLGSTAPTHDSQRSDGFLLGRQVNPSGHCPSGLIPAQGI